VASWLTNPNEFPIQLIEDAGFVHEVNNSGACQGQT
jgi:hypothetical protein